MNKFSLLFIALVTAFASCSTSPAADSDNDIVAIQAVMDKQAMAWNDGNIDAYMQGYWHNDSLQFIGSKGPVYGYTTTLERYKKAYPDKAAMGKLTFSELSYKKLSDDYYYVTGAWSLERADDHPHGYFTLLFRKVAGKWVIIADHSS